MSTSDSSAFKPRTKPIIKRIAYGTLDEESATVNTTGVDVELDVKVILELLMDFALQIVTRPEGSQAAVAVLTGLETPNDEVKRAFLKFCHEVRIRLYNDPALHNNPWLFAFGVRVKSSISVKKPPLANHLWVSQWYVDRVLALHQNAMAYRKPSNTLRLSAMGVLMSFGFAHELVHLSRHFVRHTLGSRSQVVSQSTPSKWKQPRYGVSGFDGGYEFERRMEGGFLEGAWTRITDNAWLRVLRQAENQFSTVRYPRSDDMEAEAEAQADSGSSSSDDEFDKFENKKRISENGPFDFLNVRIPFETEAGNWVHRHYRLKDSWVNACWDGLARGTFNDVKLPPEHEEPEFETDSYFTIVPRHARGRNHGWHSCRNVR